MRCGCCFDGDSMAIKSCYDGEFGVFQRVTDFDQYTGETTVTPNLETQVLETANKVVFQNITVNPIPNNYGLITWNGAILTVS